MLFNSLIFLAFMAVAVAVSLLWAEASTRVLLPQNVEQFAMLEENKTNDVYFEHDGHWNQHGIKIAAENIAAQWRELELSID